MSRTRNAAPSYIPHAKSGRGRLQWYDATGTRREKLLPGPFGSPESLAAKARLELELAASPTRDPAPEGPPLSVAELLCAYLDFAEKHYRGPDGRPTDEVRHIKAANPLERDVRIALRREPGVRTTVLEWQRPRYCPRGPGRRRSRCGVVAKWCAPGGKQTRPRRLR